MPDAAVVPNGYPLTLILPLREDVTVDELTNFLREANPTIQKALDEVGTVHYSRFMVFDGSTANFRPPATGRGGQLKLAVITTYDEEFDVYIGHFVKELGEIFDKILLNFVVDGAKYQPVADNAEAFTEWLREHDTSQHPPHRWPPHKPSQYRAYTHSVQAIKAQFGE